MKEKIKIINLSNHIPSASIILTGRDPGEELRSKLELDKIEDEIEVINISVPDRIVSFNSSYFLGLFTPSIKKYKTKEEFLKKYKFKCDKWILKDIDDGINEALKKSNVLK
jgi:hypothetical protein